jgi:hypothetical protein
MVGDSKSSQTVIPTPDSSSKVNSVDGVPTNGRMEVPTKATSQRASGRVGASGGEPTGMNSRGSIRMM